MIHSLSGGVLSDGDIYTFVKVETEGTARWYVSPLPVKEGDRVVVPVNFLEEKEGVVLKVESHTVQTAPCPLKRAPEILRVLQ